MIFVLYHVVCAKLSNTAMFEVFVCTESMAIEPSYACLGSKLSYFLPNSQHHELFQP